MKPQHNLNQWPEMPSPADEYQLMSEYHDSGMFEFRWAIRRGDGSLVFRAETKKEANLLMRRLEGLEPLERVAR